MVDQGPPEPRWMRREAGSQEPVVCISIYEAQLCMWSLKDNANAREQETRPEAMPRNTFSHLVSTGELITPREQTSDTGLRALGRC